MCTAVPVAKHVGRLLADKFLSYFSIGKLTFDICVKNSKTRNSKSSWRLFLLNYDLKNNLNHVMVCGLKSSKTSMANSFSCLPTRLGSLFTMVGKIFE